MRNHSIKVPRLYKVSAQVAKEVSEGIGSIKNIVYEKQKKHPNIKAIYALVTTLFQKSEEIEILLKRSQLLIKEIKFDPWLAKILIVELLWGKKHLPGQSRPENTIRAYEQIFKAHLSDSGSKENDFKDKTKPRYVRVNTLKCSLNEAIEGFRDEGWILSQYLDKSNYEGYLEKIKSLNNDEFVIDIHVSNLLVFPSGTEFYKHPAYKNGTIILQDKASCLPVQILNPVPGSTVLDMCAAPGMKTTHLAAVINDKGAVYATEMNQKRFEVLKTIVSSCGATCVKTINKDVLSCTKEDFNGVEYILVDPSCSGTGMCDRTEKTEICPSRLARLSGFQIKILRHALTKFPDVKRAVYSTCSLLPEENEEVVRQVLETNYNFKLVPVGGLIGENWKNFGSDDYGDLGRFCMYAKPEDDCTNGFFVAVFERLAEGEENPFFNTRIFNFKKHVEANDKWKMKKQKKMEREIDNENGIMGKKEEDEERFLDKKQNKKKRNYGKSPEDANVEKEEENLYANEAKRGKNKKKTPNVAVEDRQDLNNVLEYEEEKNVACHSDLFENTRKKKKKTPNVAVDAQPDLNNDLEKEEGKNIVDSSDLSKKRKKTKKKTPNVTVDDQQDLNNDLEKGEDENVAGSSGLSVKRKKKEEREKRIK
ncbi:28S rRNA (cytosine-C(5))-methyltransferase [Diorhabda sublineata]|uniref:28S rRNA (cytosine-C(5))-methyltransferase n=1 Tax=Diorhabda sublineata TaxID=1163346 RepID=UPI0024E13DE1|nr:28S rRNA (cytosine-C(5))-methyltransferase [Diorhabda sublineata]